MTDTIGKAQIEVGVDASGVDVGIERAKKSVASLGEAAKNSGKDGAAGMAEIGKAGEDSANKLDAASKRFVASVERQALAVGKTKSEYISALAAQKGLTDAVAPYVTKLAEAERAADALRKASREENFKVDFSTLAASVATGQAAFALLSETLAKVKEKLEFVSKSIEMGEQFQDMSTKLGLSIRDLAKFELAAQQSGTSVETIGKGIKSLSTVVTTNSEVFKKLGIDTEDSNKALMQLADIVAVLPDNMQRNALATALFNKSGMEMIPMLKMGSQGLEEAAEKSAKYAAAMEALAPQSKLYKDNMAEVAMNSKIFGMTLANDMLPGLIQISAAMALASQESGSLMASWVGFQGLVWEFSGIKQWYATSMGLAAGVAELRGQLQELSHLPEQAAASYAKAQSIWSAIAAMKTEAKSPEKIKPPQLDEAAWQAQVEKYKGMAKELLDALKPEKSATDQAQTAYDNLIKSINEKIAVEEAEAAAGRKLSDGEKQRAEMLSKLAELNGKIAPIEKARADLRIQEFDRLKEHNAEIGRQNKLYEETAKQREAGFEAMEKDIAGIVDNTAKIREHNVEIALGKEALEQYKIAQVDATLATLQDSLAQIDESHSTNRQAEQIRGKIAALQDYRRALGETSEALKMADAVKAQAEVWKSIDQVARDTFVSIFNSGKSAFDRLRDTLKNGLYALLYEMTLKKWLISIAASVSGASVVGSAFGATAASAGGSVLGNVGMSALGSGIGNWALGGSSFMGALSGSGTMGAMFGGAGNTLMNFAADTLGIVNTTALSFAQMVPVIGTAVAGVALLSKVFGSGGGPSVGGSAWSESAGTLWATDHSAHAADAQMAAYAQGVQATLDKTIAALGGHLGAQIGLGYSTDPAGDSPSSVISGVKNAAGMTTWSNWHQDVGRDTASLDAALQLEAQRSILAALQTSNLPEYLRKVFDGLTPSSATAEQIGAASAFAAQLKTVRDALTETRTPLQVLQDNAASMAAALHTTAATFKTDMVKAIDDGIGPDALAQWQGLQTALQNLADASGTATDAANAAAAATRSAADIANERKSLQDQLDQLTLSNTELLAKQRNALDDSNRALFDQIQTATDAKAAAEALAASQAKIAQERQSLQDQLDQLTLSNTALLDKQRNALDDSNRALFDQIQTATDAKAAAEALAASQAKIAQERQSLQDQLDQITLSNTELLAKQRNALDDSNRALFDQVQAAKTAAQAEQDLATARQKALDNAMKGVADAFSAMQRSVQAEKDSLTAANNAAVAEQQRQMDASGKAITDAFDILKRSVQSEKDGLSVAYNTALADANDRLKAVTDTVGQLTNLSSLLKSTVDSMRPLSRADAQAQVLSALTIAKAGGPLPQADALKQALSVVAQPNQALFKSVADFQRDYQQTANHIADLGKLTDNQLSVEQLTLNAVNNQIQAMKDGYAAETARLDSVIATAQRQLDAINGVNTSVTTVTDAVIGLNAAIGNSTASANAAMIATLNAGYAAEIARLDNVLSAGQRQVDAINGVNTSVLSVAAAISGLASALNAAGAAKAAATVPPVSSAAPLSAPAAGPVLVASANSNQGLSILATDSAMVAAAKVLYQSAMGGVSSALYSQYVGAVGGLSNIAGWGGDPAALRKYYGFAEGGDHPGGYRMVGEQGPELEWTPPSHIFSNTDTRKLFDVEGLRDEIRQLREELRAGQIPAVQAQQEMARLLRRFEGNGIPVRNLDPTLPIDVAVV